MSNYDVVIIGAGITGLSAAVHLSRNGKKVLVVEKANEPGGLLAGYSLHGYNIEKFYHHILAGDETLLGYLDELQITDKLIWLPSSVGYLIDRTIYKLDTPGDILKFPALNFWDKIRLGLLVTRVRKTKDTSKYDNVSAKDWLIQHAGIKVYRNFFEPLLRGKFGDNLNTISAAWMMERIRIRSSRSVSSGEQLGYLEGGFSLLLDTTLRKLKEFQADIRLNTGVDKIMIEKGQLKGIQIGEEKIYTHCVINTSSPRILNQIAGEGLPQDYREKLLGYQFQHTLCLVLGLDRQVTNTYWINIANQDLPFSLILEHTNFYNKIYKNHHILYLATYIQDFNHPQWKLSDGEIFQSYFDALRNLFNISPENIIWWRLGRGTYTSPVYTKGYLSQMLPLSTPIPGLYTAGMMHSYPERSINDSIRQGEHCARLILKEYTEQKNIPV